MLARQHYEKAFNCGQVRAVLALAKFYTLGLGVRKEDKKVEEWTIKAMSATMLDQSPPDIFPFVRMFD
ncbi:hypothetical protein MFLAVUS_006759 [Mucor flavus]|uniref:Uncharacterized protein n=1 Tax=Mucor flavus TaxID=439312 RepID=A0ABP9Z2E8_9FUNG